MFCLVDKGIINSDECNTKCQRFLDDCEGKEESQDIMSDEEKERWEKEDHDLQFKGGA